MLLFPKNVHLSTLLWEAANNPYENEASGLMCRGKGEPQQSTGPWIDETLRTVRNSIQFKHLFGDKNVSVIQEGGLFWRMMDILISSLP